MLVRILLWILLCFWPVGGFPNFVPTLLPFIDICRAILFFMIEPIEAVLNGACLGLAEFLFGGNLVVVGDCTSGAAAGRHGALDILLLQSSHSFWDRCVAEFPIISF
jgi:hypothetical protein